MTMGYEPIMTGHWLYAAGSRCRLTACLAAYAQHAHRAIPIAHSGPADMPHDDAHSKLAVAILQRRNIATATDSSTLALSRSQRIYRIRESVAIINCGIESVVVTILRRRACYGHAWACLRQAAVNGIRSPLGIKAF